MKRVVCAMWKKLISSNDLLCFERHLKNYNERIEARKLSGRWEIIKKLYGENLNFVEEFTAKTLNDAKQIISKLKKQDEMSPSELRKVNTLLKKDITIDLERVYKDKNVEKWSFFVRPDQEKNNLFLKMDEDVDMDVLLLEKYKYVEDKILDTLMRKLGIDEMNTTVCQNVYYISKASTYTLEMEEDEMVFNQVSQYNE